MSSDQNDSDPNPVEDWILTLANPDATPEEHDRAFTGLISTAWIKSAGRAFTLVEWVARKVCYQLGRKWTGDVLQKEEEVRHVVWDILAFTYTKMPDIKKLEESPKPILIKWLNTAIRYWIWGINRKKRRWASIETEEGTMDIADPRSDPRSDGKETEVRADYEKLYTIVQSLPPKYGVVLWLYYWEHRSANEVAGLLDITAGTVRTRLHRARLTLRRRLERESGQ
jgi:RNA polymerase sigma factor (sigma-70 family)